MRTRIKYSRSILIVAVILISTLLSNCNYSNGEDTLNQESLIKTHLASITNMPIESTDSANLILEIKNQAPTIVPRNINFEFTYKETPCGINPVWILDSKNKILKYEPLGGKEYINIYLELSGSELDTIYLKAVEIGFFRYPSVPGFNLEVQHPNGRPPTVYCSPVVSSDGCLASVQHASHHCEKS